MFQERRKKQHGRSKRCGKAACYPRVPEKNGRLLACGKLSWSSTVIFTGQPVITRAVDDGSYKEKDRRTLGNRSGTELCIRSFKPCHQKI